MRILQFITPNGFYGAERWVLALANNLHKNEAICDLAVTKEFDGQDLRVADFYPKDKGDVHYLSMKGKFDIYSAIDQLVEIIKKRNIDVIHTHGYKSDIIGLWAARKAGIRAVSTPHGFPTEVGFKMKLFIALGSRILRNFDAVAPLSADLVNDMKRLKVPDNKTVFIENGVDLTESTLLPEKELNTKPISAPVLGYVGQLIPRKGISHLINAFNSVFEKYPDAQLQLIGDGEQRAELEQLSNTLPCANNVKFLGFRDDRLELIQKFDMFCMTSELEGIPRCLMESMSLNTPVVAYKIPGVDQLIKHEVNGLLATYGDISSLSIQILRMIEDHPLRLELTIKGKQIIEERFSARRMAEEYITLFDRLITNKDLVVA